MAARQQTVLVVEDDDDLRLMHRNALVFSGFAVHDVANGFDAIRRIDISPPDIVVLDLRLRVLDVACVLRKPVDPDELARTVRRCPAKGAGAVGV